MAVCLGEMQEQRKDHSALGQARPQFGGNLVCGGAREAAQPRDEGRQLGPVERFNGRCSGLQLAAV